MEWRERKRREGKRRVGVNVLRGKAKMSIHHFCGLQRFILHIVHFFTLLEIARVSLYFALKGGVADFEVSLRI